jgi:hypothetical protein
MHLSRDAPPSWCALFVETLVKTRSTALVAGLLLAGLATFANAQSVPQNAPGGAPAKDPPAQREGGGQRPPRGEGGQGGARRGGGPNLEAAMKAMNSSLKALKANVADASKKDENLKQVAIFQYGCAASKAAPMPGDVGKELDADAKAKLEVKFRADLRAVMGVAMQLEEAIIAGKTDEATKLVTKLAEMRDAGHQAMGLKDED